MNFQLSRYAFKPFNTPSFKSCCFQSPISPPLALALPFTFPLQPPPTLQQHTPFISHQDLTSNALTSRSSPIRPNPSVFSHVARSSSTIGSYMRIFSCEVGSR